MGVKEKTDLMIERKIMMLRVSSASAYMSACRRRGYKISLLANFTGVVTSIKSE